MGQDEPPPWELLALREPTHGQYVEVLAESWNRPRWLVFDAVARRLRDPTTNMHFWYPERMMWRPLRSDTTPPGMGTTGGC